MDLFDEFSAILGRKLPKLGLLFGLHASSRGGFPNVDSHDDENFAAQLSKPLRCVHFDTSEVFVHSLSQRTDFAQDTARLLESREESLRFARGSMRGLGLEAALILCLYFLWEVGHLFR